MLTLKNKKMKPQSIQKLIAFIIFMIFSSSFLYAQKCKGPNKILVCQCARYSDFICYYVCKCIHESQLKEHLRNGWAPSDDTKSNTNPSDLFSISVINSTSINVALIKSQSVSLKIYDVTGRLVRTIADGRMSEGYHKIEWNKRDEAGNPVNTGTYILRINASVYSDIKKLLIL